MHKPEDYHGRPIIVEGFLICDGVDLWLTEKTENWEDKKRSVQVGDIGLAKNILEVAPEFTMCGSVLLATESRIAGVVSPSNGTYLLSFARVDEVALKEDDGNWLSLDLHWHSENSIAGR